MNPEELFNPDPAAKKKKKEDGQIDRAVEILQALAAEGTREITALMVMAMATPPISPTTWCRARTLVGMKKQEQRPDGWCWVF